jgi:hypothetical protein
MIRSDEALRGMDVADALEALIEKLEHEAASLYPTLRDIPIYTVLEPYEEEAVE